MPTNIDKKIIFKATEEVIKQAGCTLLEVKFRKNSDKVILSLVIDKKNGIKIEDCEQVTKLVDPLLDSMDEISGKYDFLSVSSAGLDRPFENTEDYMRHVGEKIEVKLYSAIDKKKFLQLMLTNVDDEYLILKYNNSNLKISRSNIKKANIAIEFNGGTE